MRSCLVVLLSLLAACADPPLDQSLDPALDLKLACEAQARGVLATCGPPAGYYDAVEATTPDTLRRTLHEAIDDHLRVAWNRTRGVDTWVMLEAADAEPDRPGWLRDVYRHHLYRALGGGYGEYDREHAWPKSYGFPDENAGNYPYSDGHALFIADGSYNSSRGNNAYGWCDNAECQPRPIADGTDANHVDGERDAAGTWQTWTGRRGDVARALFYLDVRYEGGTHRHTNRAEPDLVLTDDRALIAASNTGNNEALAYMGLRRVLIEWHRLDPVDARERARNDIIAFYQGNRNPFVDRPEWVECLFAADCHDGNADPIADPWISELHYDNAGADIGEFIEITGPANLDLEGWTVLGYNGRDGRVYASLALTGRIDDEGTRRGAIAFDFPGLQNGDPDGLALVDPDGRLVEFISYDGHFLATDGPAGGEGSDDIGVAETGDTPAGHSLIRDADGIWTGPRAATRGRMD